MGYDDGNGKKQPGKIIADQVKMLPGFLDSNRNSGHPQTVISKHGKTASKLYEWGMIQSPTCPHCGSEHQAINHKEQHKYIYIYSAIKSIL
jgi:hypothetical protein